jgi:DNA-binding LytR/AlgR family response regulator
VNKARDYYDLVTKNGNEKVGNDQFCFIRCDNRYEKILFEEILYIEALQNYVMIYTKNKKLISYLTIKSIEDHLPGDQFIKVNKSSIIPLSKIDTITGNVIQVGAHTFTVGRPYREQVFAKTLGDKLIRRNK